MTSNDLFHAGKLGEAIKAQIEEVRSHPTDPARRLFLSELFCFTGEFERADSQLDALGQTSAEAMPVAAVFRHLIRAAVARDDFFASGRVPEFLGQPEGAPRILLEASVMLRDGAAAEAVELYTKAETERVAVHGHHEETPFADFRDLDDRTSSVLEVLTTKGQYFWIPLDKIESLEFTAPTRPRDLLWRPAHLIVSGGPDGEVFIPALYPGAAADPDDAVRTGRTTDWKGGDGAIVTGVGQRTFLVGEEAVPIMELTSLTFGDEPAA